MGKDIKAPDEYNTTKFTLYLYPRTERRKNAGKQPGKIICTNTNTKKNFNYYGELLDFMIKQANILERKRRR